MKMKRNGSASVINKIVSGALIVAMMLALLITNVGRNTANLTLAADDATILYFEQAARTFEIYAGVGTARENLDLPSELSAVGITGEFVNQYSGTGEEYAEGSTATESSLDSAYGAETIDDINVVELGVHVTWEGEYNGDEPGVYILTAQAVDYEYNGEMPTAIVTVRSVNTGTGSISGFIWVDGNGDLDTDWDGLYNADEYPLPNYPVSLYNAGDLSSAIAVARTDQDGIYIFDDLGPGSYVLEVRGGQVDDTDYLPPMTITRVNKFAIDWAVSGLPAYTEVIDLGEAQAAQGINAGMRLPMGIAPRAATTVANLWNANINDTLFVDNYTWVVVKKQTVGSGTGAVNAVYLILRGGLSMNQGFGPNTIYNESTLRARFNRYYEENRWPTIGAMALVPDIGTDHSQSTAGTNVSLPTAQKATVGSKDVYFAPSLKDMLDWAGVSYGADSQIPSYHPLYKGAPQPFPTRFYFRTARTAAELYGYFRTANMLEGGIHHNGYDQTWDTPGVWVDAGAVEREVTVHYIDTAGNPIGSPTSRTYDVAIGSAFSLPTGQIPNIGGYQYIEWRKSLSGPPEDFSKNPNLTAAEVMAGTDLYLVYEDDSANKVKVHYVDVGGNDLGVPPDIFRIPDGGDFTLSTIPSISGYRYTGYWREGSITSPSKDTDVIIHNVTSDIDVFLIFERTDIVVAEGRKNAYINGSSVAENGLPGDPVPIGKDQEIKYTITAYNNKLPGNPGARYDVLFVLDWSTSMGADMVPGQSARLYERDVMLDMSDFILNNYPDSRVAVLGMNSDRGLNNNPDYTYIQYETDFLNATQYASELQNIRNAFNAAPAYVTEDLVSFFKAANQKLEAATVNNVYGSALGRAKTPMPRQDKSRTPVIVLMSDFQIPRGQTNGSYWDSYMSGQSERFATQHPNGILLTVRLDHKGNTPPDPNGEYSTAVYDNLMRTNVSPKGRGNWRFIKLTYGTSYTEALLSVRSDFLSVVSPGATMGTIITDKVPEGLEVDISSISHGGVYDQTTRIIRWDLSDEAGYEVTVEFTATVKEAPRLFINTADVTYYDGTNGRTNTTYHESTLNAYVDVTISKTVTGSFANNKTVFGFTVYLVDEMGPGVNAGKVFAYTGGVIPGIGATAPDDDVLILSNDTFDRAMFNLSHGQTITIKDVPVGTYIMIVETLDDNYATRVIDSKDGSVTEGHFTDMQPLGDKDRRFDFINKQDGAVPTGVRSEPWSIARLALESILIIALGMAALALIKRRMATN